MTRGKLTAVLAVLLAVSLPAFAQTRRKTRVSDDPRSPDIIAAEAARDQKDYAKAEQLLKAAIKAEPQNYYAWFDLGSVYTAMGKTDEAIDAYRRSVEANPAVIESNVNLAVLLANSGASEAGKYLRAAARLKPNAEQLAFIKRVWLVLGNKLTGSDVAGALDAYEQAAALDTKDPAPHIELGQLHERAHSDAAAEGEYKKALEIDPKSSDALALLTNVYLRTKRYPEAEASLRQFVQVQPASANGHLQLGRVLAAADKHEDAVGEFEKALELSPSDTDTLASLAESQYRLKRFDAAVATLKALVAKKPNDPQAHYSLGRAALHKGDFQLALNESLTAGKLKPDFAEAYGQAALAASEQKDYPLAIKALDYRAKLAPETAGSLFLRATCLDNLKMFPQASEYYKKFLAEANGRFPDEEWKARHRLVAIDPASKKK